MGTIWVAIWDVYAVCFWSTLALQIDLEIWTVGIDICDLTLYCWLQSLANHTFPTFSLSILAISLFESLYFLGMDFHGWVALRAWNDDAVLHDVDVVDLYFHIYGTDT